MKYSKKRTLSYGVILISVLLAYICRLVKSENVFMRNLADQCRNCIYQGMYCCLLYTSDAADDLIGVDLGGRRIIKKKIFSSRRRHTRCLRVSWARRCV